MSEPMVNVLPLWQPWATLVALGAKRIETRHWPTPKRLLGERIAIYATKGGISARDERELLDQVLFHDALRQLVPGADGAPTSKQIAGVLPRGALIATVIIERCSQISLDASIVLETSKPSEFAFGNYEAGRYAWVLKDVEPLAEPVVWRSEEEDGWKPRQGIFKVPASIVGLAPTQETLPLEDAA